MIEFIEDGDLWRWVLPGAKAFYAGLTALNLEYDANKNPAIFDELLALSSEQLIAKARASTPLIRRSLDCRCCVCTSASFQQCIKPSSRCKANSTGVRAQGEMEMQRQDRLIAKAMEDAYTVQLGGAHGAAQGWGRALAVHLDTHQPDVVKLRSELGNRLADASAAAGLAAMGVIAYIEVRSAHRIALFEQPHCKGWESCARNGDRQYACLPLQSFDVYEARAPSDWIVH